MSLSSSVSRYTVDRAGEGTPSSFSGTLVALFGVRGGDADAEAMGGGSALWMRAVLLDISGVSGTESNHPLMHTRPGSDIYLNQRQYDGTG